MSSCLLSVIIPFLNEGDEVAHTLKSIRFNSDNNIEIIIINDASTDGYNYQSIAEKYHAIYIVNKKRLGVAASRDKGIQLCTTPYFLLLDAHMRFYDHLWVDKIIYQLQHRDRVLLCCQTKFLYKENDQVIENKNASITYGAYIDFANPKNLLGASWTSYLKNSMQNIIPIACILGAGYACSKKYWQYLKGLSGLLYYGSDESYISLKVWMEGGECLLLKNVTIGHVYRSQFPYSVENLHTLYNRMLVANLLLPISCVKKISALTKYCHLNIYNEIILLLNKNKKQIFQLKLYYEQILKNSFDTFLALNESVQIKKDGLANKHEILKEIANASIIQSKLIIDIGIINGRMSNILFLFHYARYTKEMVYSEIAETILGDLLEELQINQSIFFHSGLSGIGWCIEYLYQNEFIGGDTNEILEEFDEKIMEINPLRVQDLSLKSGLGGIVLYLLSRLHTIHKENKINPFDAHFLKNICIKIKSVMKNNITDCDSIDIFIKFINYYNDNDPIEKTSLYDITYLPDYHSVEKYTPGLHGSVGMGLKLIFDTRN
jgi:glycosyltransferase involved in cell wall biosynthesis